MIPSLFASIEGEPKTGKTHLALTWPDPILVFSFDLGLDPVKAKFPDKKIEVKTYPIPVIDTLSPKPYAWGLWASFARDYKEAAQSELWATIIVDTGTHAWELDRQAYKEEVEQKNILQVQYGEPNIRMSGLLLEPRQWSCNVVWTFYQKDRWLKGENTGLKELDGYKKTKGLMDVCLETNRNTRKLNAQEQKEAGGRKVLTEIMTTITDCRFDLDLCGMDVSNMTYDDLIGFLGWTS